MKTAWSLRVAFVAAASLPFLMQQANTFGQQEGSGDAAGMNASGSAKAVYSTQGHMDFGDESASRAYEMSSVTGELQGKLSSKSAKVGDQVILKTTEKVRTSDGTEIPKGTRLVGHITQVQAHDSTHGESQMSIAFDRAELKNGQSLAIHTLIRGASPGHSAMAMESMNSDDSTSTFSGGSMSGSSTSGTRSGRSGGGVLGGDGGLAGGTVERTTATASSVTDRSAAAAPSNTAQAVQLAGHGDIAAETGAHQQAAARAIPRPTAIPGVMLAGSGSASGMFSASSGDIAFESGTEMQLGIVVDR